MKDKLIEIRKELMFGVENKDLLYIKMQINNIDTLLYNMKEDALTKEINRSRVRTIHWKKITEKYKKELDDIYENRRQVELDKAYIIIKIVKDKYSLSDDYNVLISQKPEVLEPIYKAVKLVENNTKLKLNDLQNLFNKDRSTITYILKTIDDIMDTDKKYKAEYKSILKDNKLEYKKHKPRK